MPNNNEHSKPQASANVHIVMQHTKQIEFTVCVRSNSSTRAHKLNYCFFFHLEFETLNECFNWKRKKKMIEKSAARAHAHLVHGKIKRFDAQFHLISSKMLTYWEIHSNLVILHRLIQFMRFGSPFLQFVFA